MGFILGIFGAFVVYLIVSFIKVAKSDAPLWLKILGLIGMAAAIIIPIIEVSKSM